MALICHGGGRVRRIVARQQQLSTARSRLPASPHSSEYAGSTAHSGKGDAGRVPRTRADVRSA